MNWIILIAALMGLSGVLVALSLAKSGDSFGDRVGSAVAGCFIGLVVGGVFGLVVSVHLGSGYMRSHVVQVYDRQVVSLSDVQGNSGRFVLATGSIGLGMRYVFYERQDDGGLVLRSIVAGPHIVIYEVDGNFGRIEQWGTVWYCDWDRARALGTTNFIICGGFSTDPYNITYRLYIPKGSMQTDIVLDGQ